MIGRVRPAGLRWAPGIFGAAVMVLWCAGQALAADKTDTAGEFTLQLRSRVETSPGSKRFHAIQKQESWPAEKTAVIVCDMWDLHHCLNATRRGAEMAPRMNEFLARARAQGAIIIHAPSSCMEAYKDHPARARAVETPRAGELPAQIGEWCYKIPAEEQGEYPIDQTDGGEDDDPQEHQQWAEKLAAMGRDPRAPWKSQTDLLTIADEDYISDNGEEVWSILAHRGRDNVLLVGVHTNMCVLGRPFGLRQLAKNGKHVALVRDMTDTMYNPARAPYVSHFTGTDLIVEHIEKWVCPTVTSDQILGGEPFRFQHDRRPRLAVLMGDDEYKTEETLPKFAREELGKDYAVHLIFASDSDRNDFPGMESLAQADAAIISVRRRVLPAEQMAVVRKFVESGKPVIGIRTASHAFSLRSPATLPTGYADWPELDADIWGGNYTGHHGAGPRVAIRAAEGAESHPLLQGVAVEELFGAGSLYQTAPLASSATALLIGEIPEKPAEPVAFVNTTKYKGRAFYTSLGHVGDFEQPAFRRLLKNAIAWAVAEQRTPEN